LDINQREKRYVHRVRGEKWGPELTEIVRRFPFPEISEAKFVPEGTVWLETAKGYKMRCVNEVFRIYYVDDDATGRTLSKRKSLIDHAPGRLHYYILLLNTDLEYFFHSPTPFLKAAAMLPVLARCLGRPLRGVLRLLERPPARLLVLLMFPAAMLLYAFDRIRARLAGAHA
jgi:hypothetical protein